MSMGSSPQVWGGVVIAGAGTNALVRAIRKHEEFGDCILYAVEHLVAEGANFNAWDSGQSGETPLHAACNAGLVEVVEMLLNAGRMLTNAIRQRSGEHMRMVRFHYWQRAFGTISRSQSCCSSRVRMQTWNKTPVLTGVRERPCVLPPKAPRS
jgi:hypothetical protein